MVERELQRGNAELLALKAWAGQIAELLEAFANLDTGLDMRVATPGPWHGSGLPQQALSALMHHFHQVCHIN